MEDNQFTVVSYKIDEEDAVIRQFFVKQHIGDNDIKPSDRTLLVMNIPPYLNDECFKFFYEHCGAIEHIYFHSKPKSGIDGSQENSTSPFAKKEIIVGYKCAYIVFKKPSSLVKALKSKELDIIPSNIIDLVGVEKYIEEYKSKFIDVDAVKKEVEEYMKYYDQSFEEEKQKSKNMTVDEDGFITVKRRGRKPLILKKEIVNHRLFEKQKKAAEKHTFLNFYWCQPRLRKEEKVLELRKKFENDKKRIALMKEKRKFRPF